MRFTVACVGGLKEKYWREAQAEYLKRMSRFASVEIAEVAEVAPRNDSAAGIAAAVAEESERLAARCKKDAYRIALAIEGERLSSEGFSQRLEELKLRGVSSVCFFIGGSCGLSPELKKSCDMRLSFSDFTMAHQLFRVVLLEQLYRAMKIAAGETYHK